MQNTIDIYYSCSIRGQNNNNISQKHIDVLKHFGNVLNSDLVSNPDGKRTDDEIFSDDMNYISNWSILKNIDHEIIDLNDPEELLVFMSFCDNFIIANSTLSLVAYLLRNNKNGKIVGPRNWFGSVGYKYKIEDIVPSETILI